MRAWVLVAFAVLGFSSCKPKPSQVDAGTRVDAGVDAGVRDAGSDCPTGLSRCPRGCVNLRSEWLDCGFCGNTCSSDELCNNGACRPSCAQPGEMYCGGTECAHPQTDSAHCGRCGNACSPTERCDAGTCMAVPGLAECDGMVVNVTNDEQHCGACNQPCTATQMCSAGVCCESNQTVCGGACVNSRTDRSNCGGCNRMCGSSQVCTNGSCVNCLAGQQVCNDACTTTRTDPQHCGACGNQCGTSQTCVNSVCVCPPALTSCGMDCVDLFSNTAHCGTCGTACANGGPCIAGTCLPPCPAGLTLCAGQCVNTATSNASCGACNVACGANQDCDAGSCVTCAPGPNADCDHDGYTVAEGDCCDTPGTCAQQPERVNPGAFEVTNNFIDDNCNGLLDFADTVDVDACDAMLASNSMSAIDAAKALDICRSVTLDGGVRTWGLISADWQLVNGQPLAFAAGKSIRPGFGATWVPQRGDRLLVISSGMAADSMQTNPGPNVGPMGLQSESHGSVANISQVCDGGCLRDWFIAANPPVKSANQLPTSPVCAAGNVFDPHLANDSVMLILRLRVPTNARAFSLSASFFSVEYPEFVCTDFNDQLVVLVGTSSPTWPQPNPPDMNLATYREGPLRFPVGINVAAGAGIFEACETVGTNLSCDDSQVSTRSCSAGLGPLAGTGFEKPSPLSCAEGGATRWLLVRGNVKPGEELTLRLALWDVGDDRYDSTALLDAFRWELNPVTPGTE
ncbi:MAG: choice-of-anchor L domain-containing protein [Archangium sp.]|nr:choice-of-anchor L domain-containing protein [Archangium sp.]